MQLAFVIPAYNEEALVGKCLDSVLAEIRRVWPIRPSRRRQQRVDGPHPRNRGELSRGPGGG